MKRHGPDAPIHAAMRANAMLEAGDPDGYAAWKRILRAVEEIQETVPGAQVHRAPVSRPDFSFGSTLECPLLEVEQTSNSSDWMSACSRGC